MALRELRQIAYDSNTNEFTDAIDGTHLNPNAVTRRYNKLVTTLEALVDTMLERTFLPTRQSGLNSLRKAVDDVVNSDSDTVA